LGPPDARQRSRELLLGADLARLLVRSPFLGSAPLGDGGPVLLVPGFGATDHSLALLGRFLRSRQHRVHSARLGRVGGDVPALAEQLAIRTAEIAVSAGRPVALVGWSIGGVLSREVARDRPELVTRVITFGSPVVGGPSYTALAGRYSPDVLAQVRQAIHERESTPITVPITAIWSRNDGVVSPAACIDRRSPNCEHVEVRSTHIGMGFDPDVWSVVADRLAH
jgi:pimeloyl-ACP methyl ester carboxylesterase